MNWEYEIEDLDGKTLEIIVSEDDGIRVVTGYEESTQSYYVIRVDDFNDKY